MRAARRAGGAGSSCSSHSVGSSAADGCGAGGGGAPGALACPAASAPGGRAGAATAPPGASSSSGASAARSDSSRQTMRPAGSSCWRAKASAMRSCRLMRRCPARRASASQAMPASVTRSSVWPAALVWRSSRPAASKSISSPSWHGQPAERQMAIRRVRCWRASGGGGMDCCAQNTDYKNSGKALAYHAAPRGAAVRHRSVYARGGQPRRFAPASSGAAAFSCTHLLAASFSSARRCSLV